MIMLGHCRLRAQQVLSFNAGCLVKARAEAMLILLDALIGEEEMLSKEAGGESNLREYVY